MESRCPATTFQRRHASSYRPANSALRYPVSNPAPWYSARDFEMTSTNPADIALAEQTFVSDFSYAPVNVIQPANEQATDRLIWSNGTTGPQANPSLQTHLPTTTQPATGSTRKTPPTHRSGQRASDAGRPHQLGGPVTPSRSTTRSSPTPAASTCCCRQSAAASRFRSR